MPYSTCETRGYRCNLPAKADRIQISAISSPEGCSCWPKRDHEPEYVLSLGDVSCVQNTNVLQVSISSSRSCNPCRHFCNTTRMILAVNYSQARWKYVRLCKQARQLQSVAQRLLRSSNLLFLHLNEFRAKTVSCFDNLLIAKRC